MFSSFISVGGTEGLGRVWLFASIALPLSAMQIDSSSVKEKEIGWQQGWWREGGEAAGEPSLLLGGVSPSGFSEAEQAGCSRLNCRGSKTSLALLLYRRSSGPLYGRFGNRKTL